MSQQWLKILIFSHLLKNIYYYSNNCNNKIIIIKIVKEQLDLYDGMDILAKLMSGILVVVIYYCFIVVFFLVEKIYIYLIYK